MAALFVDHLQREYPDAFAGTVRWRHRVPGDLGQLVCDGLNRILNHRSDPPYLYQGIEAVADLLWRDPVVGKFLATDEAAQQAFAADEPLAS